MLLLLLLLVCGTQCVVGIFAWYSVTKIEKYDELLWPSSATQDKRALSFSLLYHDWWKMACAMGSVSCWKNLHMENPKKPRPHSLSSFIIIRRQNPKTVDFGSKYIWIILFSNAHVMQVSPTLISYALIHTGLEEGWKLFVFAKY